MRWDVTVRGVKVCVCVCGAEGAGWDITVGNKGVGVGSGCGGGGTCAVHWLVVEMGGGGVCSLFSLRPPQSVAMQMVVIMWAGGAEPHTLAPFSAPSRRRARP